MTAADRAPDARVAGFVPLVPDLAAAVVSPNDRAVEVAGKALSWPDAGVRLVLVVDPENRTVTVYRPDGVGVLRGPVRLVRRGRAPRFRPAAPRAVALTGLLHSGA